MISEKKIEFLIKQGFDKDVINLFINCGVEKHLLWFLAMHKKKSIKNLNSEEIRLVNDYLNKSNLLEVKRTNYSETLRYAKNFQKNQARKNKNKLYDFENGFYISLLNAIDLKEEGELMANCVGTYDYRVEKGTVAILALKQSSGKTVAHIEVKKNGLIGQNYAKANSKINNFYWMMILEFFKNNHKEVDLSKLFGESYVTTTYGDYINEIILTVPTAVQMFIDGGTKKTEQISGFEIKRFASLLNVNESAKKFSSQNDVLDWIEEKKQNVLKVYDELKNQILETSASKMFLSDKMKERIFGNKKDAYYMKGESYNLQEIDPAYGESKVTTEAVGLEEPAIRIIEGELPFDNEIQEPEGREVGEMMAMEMEADDGPVENIVEERIEEPIGGALGALRPRRPVVIFERLRNALLTVDNERNEENFEQVPGVYINGVNGELQLEEIEYLGGYNAEENMVEVPENFQVERAEYPIEERAEMEDMGMMPPEPINQILKRATLD